MRDYKKLLKSGNKAQLEKLMENGDKPGFETMQFYYILGRLRDELRELGDEYLKKDEDWKAIRREAADIANFAHMLILRCDKELN